MTDPIRKTIEGNCTPQEAFEVFGDRYRAAVLA